MEKDSKVMAFIKGLPLRAKNYLKGYFKNLNYPLWICFVVVSIGLFLADYFTKRAAYYNETLQAGGTIENFIPGLIDLYLIGNKGAAWGSMSGWSWFLIPVSTLATIMLTINLLFRFRRYNWGMTIGITLMLPGAAGNLIDRIGFAAGVEPYSHGVIDFLKFHFWPGFPICNLADYWLTVGIVFLLIGFVFEFKKEYQKLKEEEEAEKNATKSEEEIKEDEEMAKKLSQLEKKEDSSIKEETTGSEDGNQNVQG